MTPNLQNLTPAMLAETISELTRLGGESVQVMGTAYAIIINSLGPDFWARECTSFGARQEFFTRKANPRFVNLADLIWRLRGTDGLPEFMQRSCKGDFESAYYELLAATMVRENATEVRIVVPSGQRGSDFDLLARGFLGYEQMNIEVKSRKIGFTSEKQVSNFLKSHRNQLPKEEIGAFFIKVSLRENTLMQNKMHTAIQEFLHSTSRVSYVFYISDMAEDDDAIALIHVGVGRANTILNAFPNSRSRTPIFMREGLAALASPSN